MSAEFSRRSFLKYTALAAVAVAGSSLLTGCGGENPVKYEVPSSNVVLSVKSTLDSVSYDAAAKTLTFNVTVQNGRAHALQINRQSFAVKAVEGSYYAYNNSRIKVYNTSESPSLQVKNGVTQTYTIVASEFEGFDGDAVRLTFMPDLKYAEYTSNWVLQEAAFAAAEDSTAATAAYALQGMEV